MNTRVYNHYPTGDTKRSRGIPALQHPKNLGWLLRHAHEVETIICYSTANGSGRLAAEGKRNGLCFTFITDFADYKIMKEWVKRPSLAHARHGTYPAT